MTKKWLSSVFGLLAGRKMVVADTILVLILISLLASGKITPAGGLAGLLTIAAMTSASLHDKLERHRDELLPVVTLAASVVRDVAEKNLKAAEVDGAAAAIRAGRLAGEIEAEKGTSQS